MNLIREISKEFDGVYKASQLKVTRYIHGVVKEQRHSFAMKYQDQEIIVFGNYHTGSSEDETPPYAIKIKSPYDTSINVYPRTKPGKFLRRVFFNQRRIEIKYHFSRDKISQNIKHNPVLIRLLGTLTLSIKSSPGKNEIIILVDDRHLTKTQIIELVEFAKQVVLEIKKIQV